MLKEFKEFAMRGNVLDLAVAVIIGGAFGKIITSLVNDVLMPLIGLVLGGINFSRTVFHRWRSRCQMGCIRAIHSRFRHRCLRDLHDRACHEPDAKARPGRSAHHKGVPVLLQHNSAQSHTLPELHFPTLKNNLLIKNVESTL